MLKIKPLGLTAIGLSVILFDTSVLSQSPSKTSLNPYPDELLKGLLESCRSGKPQSYQLTPASQSNTTNIRAITEKQISQLDKKAKTAEADIKKQVAAAEKQVDSQIQQRKAELKNLIRDPKQFDEQLRQLKTAIASKNTPKAQIPQLKALLKDLEEIQRNPAAINTKAEESGRTLRKRIQAEAEKARSETRQKVNNQRSRLTSCTCKIETLQQQYSAQVFYQSNPLAKGWTAIANICKQ
jgi:DNA repair exonuclease SbcCD ATPase subunit